MRRAGIIFAVIDVPVLIIRRIIYSFEIEIQKNSYEDFRNKTLFSWSVDEFPCVTLIDTYVSISSALAHVSITHPARSSDIPWFSFSCFFRRFDVLTHVNPFCGFKSS
jgi:hypothetical protein